MSKRPTAAEQRHIDRVRLEPCLVCGGPSEAHHVRGYADRAGNIPKTHWLVAPLCPTHHRHISPNGVRVSVHDLGHQGFMHEHGIDLLKEAIRLRDESLTLERDAA